jgi:DNA modification methylase
MVEVFREVKRVLHDTGTVWLNLGDSYARQGGDVKDYGNTSINKGKVELQDKRNKSIPPIGLKTKDLVGIPWRVAFALQADGWYLRQDIIWHKPNPMPESVQDRCTKSHEYIFLLTKSAKYKFNQLLEDLKPSTYNDKRLFNGNYTEQRRDRNYPGNAQQGSGMLKPTDGQANKRSVWSINTKPYKEAHFAVFPPKLPELCIKAGSSEGDIVLDPFFGSGTTGWVAQRLGRKWIGIELNEEYIKIAERRFDQHELFESGGK